VASTLTTLPAVTARQGARLATSLCIALTGLGAWAPATIAQEDGVHVDPDSPSGKEYQLPLEGARRDAAGGQGSADRGGGPAPPLFGAGISQRGTSEERPSQSGPTSNSDRRSPEGEGESDADAVEAGGAGDSGPSGDEPDGLSAGMLTGLVALGVLLVGALVGLALRTMRGTHQPT
jgi:hypothetical protein